MLRQLPRHSRARVLASILAGLAALAGCRRSEPYFSVENARSHVNRLAVTIGPRPIGSASNRQAREYLVDQLRDYGFTVRIQEADGRQPRWGLTAHVNNVIAVTPGAHPDAIALVAHYDSDDGAPGAGDDGLGVAVCLEVGRLLAARTDRHGGLMVLLTDGEEVGLAGAAAAAEDPEVRQRVRAYINIDNAGASEPSLLFESGPGNRGVLRAWRAVPHPRGGSAMFEIYRRLPNDTDFSVLEHLGVPGLNIGAIGDGYVYHTSRDTADQVTDAVLARTGENVLAAALALDRMAHIDADPAQQDVFFDVGGAWTVALSSTAATAIAVAALLLGLLAWLRVAVGGWRRDRWRALLAPWAWGVLGIVVVFVAMFGVVAGLRAFREVLHPWYAHPARTWLAMSAAAIVFGHLLFVIGARLPRSLRVPRHPASVWVVALPVWIVLAAVSAVAAPAAAYFWTLPLLVAATALVAAPAATGVAGRLTAVVALAGVGLLWPAEFRDVIAFAVPLFGRLPVVTPLPLYPVLFLGAGLMLVPPLLALVAAGRPPTPPEILPAWWRREHLLITPFLTLLFVASFAWAYHGEAYTKGRPLRRVAQYVADHATSRAMWEIAGNEPGLDIEARAGAPSGWTAGHGVLVDGVPLEALPFPFAFRAPGRIEPAPLTAEGRSTLAGSELRLEIVVATTAPSGALVLLAPPGVTPIRSSHVGWEQQGNWRAKYVAPPGPTTFSLAVPAASEPRLAEFRVGVVTRSLPGAAAAPGLPPWLGQERTDWYARAVHVIPVAWAPAVAPVPALR